MDSEPLSLVPGKTDADLAAEYRKRFAEAIKPVLALVDEASRQGLLLGFEFRRDAFGSCKCPEIQVSRPL